MRSFSACAVVAVLCFAGCGVGGPDGSADVLPAGDAGALADAGGAGSGADAGRPGLDAGAAPDAGAGDAGSPPDAGAADAGAPPDAGAADAGAPPDAGAADAGSPPDAGAADAGVDGGTAASDCDGLLPPPPGAPLEYRWAKQDLNVGRCLPAESDGTGHLALWWQHDYQPHESRYLFLDPATGAAAGSYQGVNLELIGQASGFIGGDCYGAQCQEDYVVLGPTGDLIYKSAIGGPSTGGQANDPTGGMVHVRLAQGSAGVTVLIDALDAAGTVRWTNALPDLFTSPPGTPLAVDRKGNVLALWPGDSRYGAHTWAGQWFDHAGAAGAVFRALSTGNPGAFFERTGDGLFLAGTGGWLGQFEPLGTTLLPAPAWLAARPDTRLHVVHGGRGYAVLPAPGPSASCAQAIEVISPSGKLCGAPIFPVGGGACTTSGITVGYDGSVLQQLPREREAACKYNDHECDCTYRAWRGYFQ